MSSPGHVRVDLPPDLERRLRLQYPAEFSPWLRTLNVTLTRLEALWTFRPGSWFTSSRTAAVQCVTTALGQHAVLKLPVIASDTAGEGLVLEFWDGFGAPRLYARDELSGALLLELIPGAPAEAACFRGLDLRAVGRYLAVLHGERELPPPILPSLEEKLRPLRAALREQEIRRGKCTPASERWLAKEERARRWLAVGEGSGAATRVIHGDLHARNLIWAHAKQPSAIDPYGVVGDPARDAGSLALSIKGGFSLRHGIEAIASHAGVDPLRTAAHAYVLALGGMRFRRVYHEDMEDETTLAAALSLERLLEASGVI